MRPFVSMAATAAAVALGLSACTQQPQTITYKAHLTAQDEVPPVNSKGTGDGTFVLNPATKELTWSMSYVDLVDAAAAAHIHGPAAPGTNAGVMIPLGPNGNLPSPITGKATLTDAQISALTAGQTYANIHTNTNKGGEIRGQLVKQ